MQGQINGTAGLGTLGATELPCWQVAAIDEFEISLRSRYADLRWDLSARIFALTGRHVSPPRIYTDGHVAVAGVDGATFRLYHGSLMLVRTCAYCGTGRFESPEIGNFSDLGYALSAWEPLHEDCEGYSEDTPDF